tara:strand:+ start:356 stop:499 length:144 start_codon:yes stop_codon:yes gene_type:complete
MNADVAKQQQYWPPPVLLDVAKPTQSNVNYLQLTSCELRDLNRAKAG